MGYKDGVYLYENGFMKDYLRLLLILAIPLLLVSVYLKSYIFINDEIHKL